MIKNEPKKYVGDYNVDAVRDAYENRGRWYYFLVKEGLEQGLPLEFARDAMHEAGLVLGKSRFNGIDNLKDFADEFMTYGVEKVNEGEVVKLSEEEELVKLCYTGEKAYASVISQVSKQFDVVIDIINGKIDYIHGKPLGVLIVIVRGRNEEREKALRYMKENVYRVEELEGGR